MFIAVVIFKNQWVAKHAWIFSNGALALIAWVSIIMRKPFTLQYARQQVTRDKWQHPLFIKINYILTSVWGLCFLFNVCLHVIKLYYPTSHEWVYESLSYLSIIFAIWFTSWFPKWYREKSRSK
jgi:carotenoid cleavage dioxygenase